MTKTNLNESLKKLAAIVRWFDDQTEIDVEEGLEKVKEGSKLIKDSRDRLREIENEFTELEKTMKEEVGND